MNKLSDRLPWRAPWCLNAVRQDDITQPGKTPLSRTWQPVDRDLRVSTLWTGTTATRPHPRGPLHLLQGSVSAPDHPSLSGSNHALHAPNQPSLSPGGPRLCCEVQVCPAFRSHVSTQHMVRGPHSSNRALSSASRAVSPSSSQTPHRCSVTSHSTYPTLKSTASLLSPQSCSSSSAWIPSPWTAHHLLRCSGLQPGVTHHTPHGPDLLLVFDDHSPFHALCLQSR